MKNRDKIPDRKLEEIAKKLNVSKDWLLYDGEMFENSGAKPQEAEHFVEIPFYLDVYTSVGSAYNYTTAPKKTKFTKVFFYRVIGVDEF